MNVGDSVEIKNIPVGTTYVVDEDLSGFTNFTKTITYSDSTEKKIAADDKDTVEVANKYEEPTPTTGSLTIIKSVANNTAAAIPASFQIAVKNPEGKYITDVNGTVGDTTPAYFTISASVGAEGSVQINNLTPGKYTIEEDETAAMDGVDSLLYELEVRGTGEITVTTGTNSNTVTNTYSDIPSQTGVNLKVNKVVTGYSGTTSAFNFVILEKTNGYIENIDATATPSVTYTTDKDQAKTFGVAAGGSVTVSGLENGTYAVEEVGDTSIEGYNFDGCSYSSTEIDMTASDGEVTMTNSYTEKKVSLTVEKVVTADEGTPASREYFFKVKNAAGLFVNRDASGVITYVDEANATLFSVTPGDAGKAVIGGLSTDVYTVVEDTSENNVKVNGYTFSSSSVSGGDCSNTDGTATITNTYKKFKKGALTVTKTISADHGTPAVTKVIVTITNQDGKYLKPDGTLSDSKVTIDLPVNGTSGSITIANVPDGTYKVEEELSSVVASDYKFDETSSTTTIPGLEISATSSPSADLKNAYKKLTELQISKVEAFGHESIQGATLQIQDASGKVLHQWVSTTSIEKFIVPDGTYKIHEVTPPSGHKVGLDVTFTVNDGKLVIVSGDDGRINDKGEIEFKNDPIGILSIHVKEEDTGKDVDGAVIEVTGPFDKPGVLGTKRFRTNSNGNITDDSGNEKLEVMPGDFTYKVIEVPVGYKVTKGATGTVTVPVNKEGHGEAQILPKAGLKITVLDEATGKPVPGAEVEVKKPDGTTETVTTDQNGEITKFEDDTPTGDYTITVKKVPEGYTVTVNKEQTAKVVKGNVTSVVSKINTKTGGLLITVLDEKTNEPVPNAEVEVVKPDGTKETLTTDKNGQVTKFTEKDSDGHYKAPIGDYKITVVKVPDGYNVTTGKTEVKTTEVGKVVEHIAKIGKKDNPPKDDDDDDKKPSQPGDTPSTNQQTSNGRDKIKVTGNKNTVTDSMTAAKTGESKIPYFVFGGSMTSLLIGAVIYILITKKKREEEEYHTLSLK